MTPGPLRKNGRLVRGKKSLHADVDPDFLERIKKNLQSKKYRARGLSIADWLRNVALERLIAEEEEAMYENTVPVVVAPPPKKKPAR